jgi:ABC-type transporter Mla subunit MlaD
MPAERNAFRLGLTLVLFFVLFCGVLYWLAPRGSGDVELQVRYPHERFGTPLKPGGEVLCGGKTVGSIRRLELVEQPSPSTGNNQFYAVVTFRIDSSVGLRRDCRIEPTEALLGGMGALVVKDRGLGEPVKPGMMIDGLPVTSIADLTAMIGQQLDPRNPTGLISMIASQLDAANGRSLLGKIHKSLDDINVLTRNIAGESDERERTALMAMLHEILGNVNATTAALREQMDGRSGAAALGKIHQVLDALNGSLATVRGILEENREPIHRTTGHVAETSRILEQQIATRLAQQLDTSNAASLLTRVHASIERLGRSLEDVNSITANVRDVIELNKNNLDQMIANLKETSDHLKAGSKEIRLNPWLLLYTPNPDEAAQARLFGTARAFTEAATRLDDAIVRLEVISQKGKAGPQLDPVEIQRVREQLNDTFKKFSEVEQKLWEQLNIK